ncbi:MAG: hypothetical protein QOI98_1198 [Solirubrobacteraceae bacterium]|nr:hypothetical protein [Solirubrobacteraceae bacterium]
MLKTALPVLAAVAAGLVAPGLSQAHTCSDYSNQAAAQRAADTRDADGDGVYCESLPCPCAGPTHTATPNHTTSTTGSLGRSVAFGRVTRSSACRVRNSLPDSRCTPGARFSRATSGMVCQRGYSKRVRNVPQSVKNVVFRAYGVTSHSRATYEVDHLVPLELGGSNAQANLFAEPAGPQPGFHQKDGLENRLHAQVCRGSRSLKSAQRGIARDWLTLYRAEF